MDPFVPAAALADLSDDTALAVEIDGVDVALVRDGDSVYAIENRCSHADIPLSEGEVEGCEIECWLHGSRFDLRNGEPLNLPAVEPVPVYGCRVADADGIDTVFVDLTAPINGVASA